MLRICLACVFMVLTNLFTIYYLLNPLWKCHKIFLNDKFIRSSNPSEEEYMGSVFTDERDAFKCICEIQWMGPLCCSFIVDLSSTCSGFLIRLWILLFVLFTTVPSISSFASKIDPYHKRKIDWSSPHLFFHTYIHFSICFLKYFLFQLNLFF